LKILVPAVILFVSLFCYGEYVALNKKRVYNHLMSQIMDASYRFPGEVGIYIKDLNTGMVVGYNEKKPFPSASLVKIPIMAAVWQAAEDGHLRLDDKITLKRKLKVGGSGQLKRARSGTKFRVRELVGRMITESDNTATNMLSESLGKSYINWLFKNKFRLEVTNFSRNIMDLGAIKRGIDNYTTAEEIGALLESIYRGRMVSPAASGQMLEILARQKIKDRIPRYLPSSLVVAHKTGLLQDICHDAGIVFTPRGDFIVCVLTSDFKRYRLAKSFIGEVAYRTYRCY
jgi:beta-lactamase class A